VSYSKTFLAVNFGFVLALFLPAFMLAVAPAGFGPILVTLLVLVLNLLSTVLAALLTGTTIGAPSLRRSGDREQRNGNQSQAGVFQSLHASLHRAVCL
jgi:hypothetical protein